MTKTLILVALFLGFTIPSALLTMDTGYLAWLELVRDERWALQLFVDLAIACGVFIGWLWKDAPARGLPRWPYVLATATLGSIGILAYLIHRRLARPATATA